MNRKLLLGLAAALSVLGGVFLVFPQTAPFAPVVKVIGDEVRAEADRHLDACPDSWCARDPKTGEAALVGPINPRDGGRPCECR